jgi:hypothetical protein
MRSRTWLQPFRCSVFISSSLEGQNRKPIHIALFSKRMSHQFSWSTSSGTRRGLEKIDLSSVFFNKLIVAVFISFHRQCFAMNSKLIIAALHTDAQNGHKQQIPALLWALNSTEFSIYSWKSFLIWRYVSYRLRTSWKIIRWLPESELCERF